MNLNGFIKCQETLESTSSKKNVFMEFMMKKISKVKFDFKFCKRCIGLKDSAVCWESPLVIVKLSRMNNHLWI